MQDSVSVEQQEDWRSPSSTDVLQGNLSPTAVR